MSVIELEARYTSGAQFLICYIIKTGVFVYLKITELFFLSIIASNY